MVESGKGRCVEFERGHKGIALIKENFGIPQPVHSSIYRVWGKNCKMYFMKVPRVDPRKKDDYSLQELKKLEAVLWRREHSAHMQLGVLDKPHANIVGIIDFVSPNAHPGWLYFEMEGPDLYEYYFCMNPRVKITSREMKTILESILLALVYMHAKKFAHCDLRLENVLTSPHADKRLSSIKLCDLGRSCSLRSTRIKDWNLIDGDAPEIVHPNIYGKVC